MTSNMWLVLIAVVYLSILLGLVIMSIQEKAPALIILIPFIPFAIIFFNIIASFTLMMKSKKGFKKRIKLLFLALGFSIQIMPMLFGYTMQTLSKSTINKSLETIVFKLFNIEVLLRQIRKFYNIYLSFFTSSMKKNSMRMIRYN